MESSVPYDDAEFSGLDPEENHTAEAIRLDEAGDPRAALLRFRAAAHFGPDPQSMMNLAVAHMRAGNNAGEKDDIRHHYALSDAAFRMCDLLLSDGADANQCGGENRDALAGNVRHRLDMEVEALERENPATSYLPMLGTSRFTT
jgi:hypothetical protein